MELSEGFWEVALSGCFFPHAISIQTMRISVAYDFLSSMSVLHTAIGTPSYQATILQLSTVTGASCDGLDYHSVTLASFPVYQTLMR